MSFISQLTCMHCNAIYAQGEALWCPRCGINDGILEVEFDLERVQKRLTREALNKRALNHWRYRELLPIDEIIEPVPLDIGWTPMIEAPRLAEAIGIRRLRLKDDGRNASGSFKDRASSIGVTRALMDGRKAIACASTGNAASSLAHCAAVAGIQANIFVSERIPEGKLAQLLAYGARVFKVNGTYDEAWRLCMEACEKFRWYNRNCAINPYLVEGKKTGGLEIAEQSIDDPPDWVSASVGDGCSIAGIAKGLRQMKEIGIIDWQAKMLGVQAADVAPLCKAFETGKFHYSDDGDTYADSINCPFPRNAKKAIITVKESGGRYVTVTDDEIRQAVRQTGSLAGIFAEPAAAAAVAGIAAARREGIINAAASCVAVISGNGLKDIAGAITAVGQPHKIKPNIESVVNIIDNQKSSQQD